MSTKCKYAASALLSLLLCIVMLGGSVLGVAAEGNELPSLEYHNPTMESTVTLSAYDLFTRLLDRTATEGEKLYWESDELSLTYTDFIPDSSINTQYDGDNGILKVTVTPYTYEAANGSLVTWIPETVTLEGKEYSLVEENGSYTAQIGNCFYSGDFDMQVDYTCQCKCSTLNEGVDDIKRNRAEHKHKFKRLGDSCQKYRQGG